MKYSSKLWNEDYLNYDFIKIKNKKLRKSILPFILFISLPFYGFCLSMLFITIPMDIYLKLKLISIKSYKSIK